MNEQTIFSAAVERPSGERGAFLDGACAEDPAMRLRVEKLLSAYENDPSFMGQPAGTLVDTPGEQTGTQIGRYKLREQIGEGGMGVVYVADQKEPVKRKVALKIIKPGMASKDVIHRFESERQALSMMDHPNIARVFDGGITDAGQPYFVMELVQGPAGQQVLRRPPINDKRSASSFSRRSAKPFSTLIGRASYTVI